MHVWIVEHGECHRGGDVDGVYADRDRAIEALKRVIDGSPLDGRMPVSAAGPVEITDGCDWARVSSYPVL